MSEDGTQQSHPDALPLCAETIQTLPIKFKTRIVVQFLDDGNIVDDYKIVLRDLKSEKVYRLSLIIEKFDICFLG